MPTLNSNIFSRPNVDNNRAVSVIDDINKQKKESEIYYYTELIKRLEL